MSRTKASLLQGVSISEVVHTSKVDNNTMRIVYKDGRVAIRLHDTNVVITYPDGSIVLNSGGWRTSTTKDRINKFSPYRVHQSKGIWYVLGSAFYDGIILQGQSILSGSQEPNLKEVAKLKQSISKFVALITEDNLPVPSSGDCWYCSMRDKDGKGIGGVDHLQSHIDEGYVHGSLLVNAMRAKGYSDIQIRVHYSSKYPDSFKRAVRTYLQKALIPTIAVK